MRNETYNNYKRVTKRIAEKAYNAGKDILVAPCNANMHYIFSPYITINNEHDEHILNGGFENKINHFIYYNCGGCMGDYPKYFIKED